MMRRFVLFAGFAFATAASPALAQSAAETAIILGGTGPGTGAAQRSMGAAVGGSIGNAANAIGATMRPTGQSMAWRPRSAPRAAYQVPAYATDMPGDVDPLDRSKAPSYSVGTGATIRVSGGMRQRAPATATAPPPPRKR